MTMIPRKLLYRQDFFADAAASAELDVLMQHVFEFSPLRSERAEPVWVPFAYFDGDGHCIAAVEAARLELVLEGRPGAATAIRLAATAETHRGLGLFKSLMARALAWCEAACDGPTLLYTEDHALYAPFGFAPLPQHVFVGDAPAPADVALAAPLDRAGAARLFDRLAAHRTPISRDCAIVGADDLFREILRGDEPYGFAHAADLDALLVWEEDGGTLVVADVVASSTPTLAQIVSALGARWRSVCTLFPPDRLDWPSTAEPDQTGLMARGAVPAALRRPFMLPPTTAF